jgi:hypothetical protein
MGAMGFFFFLYNFYHLFLFRARFDDSRPLWGKKKSKVYIRSNVRGYNGIFYGFDTLEKFLVPHNLALVRIWSWAHLPPASHPFTQYPAKTGQAAEKSNFKRANVASDLLRLR